jgi:hypothetical protein
MKKALPILFTILFVIALLAWSPWITADLAEKRVEQSFSDAWMYVADGCGLNCKGCGAIQVQRAPFGALVTLDYACGMIPADLPEYHQQSTAFVSALGTVHGLPEP